MYSGTMLSKNVHFDGQESALLLHDEQKNITATTRNQINVVTQTTQRGTQPDALQNASGNSHLLVSGYAAYRSLCYDGCSFVAYRQSPLS